MAETLEISQSDLQKMKIAELKKELKARGLPSTGAKKELLQRLETHLNSGAAGNSGEVAAVKVEVKEETVENELDQVLEADADEIALDESTETENKPASVPTETKEEKPPAKTKIVQPLSEADKLKNRAKKFGIINEDLKKVSRAERFGIQVPSTGAATTGADMDKLKKRAERFGTVISSTLTKDEEKEKLKKRAERFGTATSIKSNYTALKGEDQEKLLKRKERFGVITGPSNDDAEAKKRKRAERFGLT